VKPINQNTVLRNMLFLVIIVGAVLNGAYWVTAIGIVLWLYIFFLFVSKLGETIPVLELMLLMAVSQWILGPIFDYFLGIDHYKYYMYVSEPAYMNYVVPATLAFIIGVHAIPKNTVALYQINEKLSRLLQAYGNIPYYLIGIGLIAPYAMMFVPASLRFVFFLLANLKYIGLVYLLFQQGKAGSWLVWVIMGLTFVSSVQSGMFHDLILWTVLMVTFLAMKFQWGTLKKVAVIFLGFTFAFLVQLVKQDFRQQLPQNRNNAVSLFFNMVESEITGSDEVFSAERLDEINVRLNQGWIISAILSNVPYSEPYAKGETIKDAVIASFVPRILNPAKKEAGGRENFERFTGLMLGTHTSMGTSIVGEAYANFGRLGGIIFMFIWGMVLALILRWLVNYSRKYPTFILWTPLIFLQVIKAETELVVVLNHLVKATVFSLGIFWAFRRLLGWKI
jgi:hypothetical protein